MAKSPASSPPFGKPRTGRLVREWSEEMDTSSMVLVRHPMVRASMGRSVRVALGEKASWRGWSLAFGEARFLVLVFWFGALDGCFLFVGVVVLMVATGVGEPPLAADDFLALASAFFAAFFNALAESGAAFC